MRIVEWSDFVRVLIRLIRPFLSYFEPDLIATLFVLFGGRTFVLFLDHIMFYFRTKKFWGKAESGGGLDRLRSKKGDI